jgi:hypothetical protein
MAIYDIDLEKFEQLDVKTAFLHEDQLDEHIYKV